MKKSVMAVHSAQEFALQVLFSGKRNKFIILTKKTAQNAEFVLQNVSQGQFTWHKGKELLGKEF